MAGQTVALVPPGGLAQIPDGGLPYWLGGLYVSDNLRHPVDRWEPTPQVEGSASSTAVGLTNDGSADRRLRTEHHQQPGQWRHDRLLGHHCASAHRAAEHVLVGERTVPSAAARADHRHGFGQLQRP